MSGGGGALFVGDEAFVLGEFGGAGVGGVVVIVFVDDGVDHDSLFVDCKGRVGGNCNPALCLELVLKKVGEV